MCVYVVCVSQKSALSVAPQVLSNFFETESCIDLELSDVIRLVSQLALEIPPVSSYPVLGLQACTQLFYESGRSDLDPYVYNECFTN